jgi:hypothetical protein
MTLNLKQVDGVPIQAKHKATCHCGAVEIELTLPDGLVDVHSWAQCSGEGNSSIGAEFADSVPR